MSRTIRVVLDLIPGAPMHDAHYDDAGKVAERMTGHPVGELRFMKRVEPISELLLPGEPVLSKLIFEADTTEQPKDRT